MTFGNLNLDNLLSAVTQLRNKDILIFCCLAYVCYLICLAIYRLFLSPIAKFPGPKLAALTYWIEAYYELWKGEGGQFPFEYRKWHEKYGELRLLNTYKSARH
jgi:hypothetical protein